MVFLPPAVQRFEVVRRDGSWLCVEADNEVVAISTQARRVVDALYLSRHDMTALVDAWLGWQGLVAVRAVRRKDG